MLKRFLKIIGFLCLALAVLSAVFAACYIKLLPAAVSNEKVISFAEKSAQKYAGVDINIENPVLKTYLSPDLDFYVTKILMSKNEKVLLDLRNLDISVSFKDIFKKVIKIKRFGADKVFANINGLLEAFTGEAQQSEKKANNDWFIDFFDSILYVNNSFIIYSPEKDTVVELKADNLKLDNTQKQERYVHFNFDGNIKKKNNIVHITFADENKVVIKNKHIYVNDCPLTINYSKMFFNADASKDRFELTVFSNRFFIPDVIKLLQTNIIENNINDVLLFLDNINGDCDFNVKLTKNDFSGNIKLNRLSAKLIPLNNMPFTVNSGDILISGNNIILDNFKGYYDKNSNNEFEFKGTLNDYLKTVDTKIDMTAVLTNDFFENYLSKTAGIKLTLLGQSRSKILINSKNNDIDVTMMGKIAKGDDILVEGSSLSPVGYDRALKADLHVRGDKLNIETINYYIAKELTRASKGVEPILTLNGNVNIPDGKIFDFELIVPKPLPSEFLNVFIGQKMFRKGKFQGNIKYVDMGKFPVLQANLTAEGIAIPSQRLFLKNGEIKTVDKSLKIKAEGKYRRSSYNFEGDIGNAIIFPILIRNIKLTLDNIDVARVMAALNSPVETADYTKTEIDENDTSDALAFDIKNLIIQECFVNIIKGNYKEINFSNIKAKMSLDKDSIFKLKSNKFEIAEGHSSLDVNCDLRNQKYNIRLGIKDVNSDIMSTALLNLKREISGKASGLIELYTDETLKLNGSIKFIVQNGTIQKIGLVEYVLKFAALFRNPLAMISPSVFSDMINIPEGNFDKITGDMKIRNNIVELMRIKSYSPQLSAYVVGSYNMENSDAILRIYTKFSNKNKGFAGFLRNFSLNSLANRIPLNSRNESNYYAAELEHLPAIDADEKDCQIFLTKVDGDVEHNNFISSLKKIK